MKAERGGGPRKARLEAAIRDHLAELIREVKDPRVANAGVIGITHVDLNADLSVARVAVSFVGADPPRIERALAGLEAAAGFLRGPLGRRLAVGRSPRLRFERDPTAEVSAELAAIVRADQAKKGEP
jgi:ribosome-binding factor A